MFSGKDVRVFPKAFKCFFKSFPKMRVKVGTPYGKRYLLLNGTIFFAEGHLLLGRKIGRYFLSHFAGSRPFGSSQQ